MDRLRLVGGRAAVRWIAPAVFLLAVTGIVLAVRSGLRDGKPAPATTATVTTVTAPAPAAAPRPAKRYTVIESGDTLGAIAARFGTTVAELERLNPGIEPTALTPGRRVRVR